MSDLPESIVTVTRLRWESTLAERDRYRNAILDAIPKLASDHWEDMENHDCDLCWPKHDDWPCLTAMVTDDLRAALDGEGT